MDKATEAKIELEKMKTIYNDFIQKERQNKLDTFDHANFRVQAMAIMKRLTEIKNDTEDKVVIDYCKSFIDMADYVNNHPYPFE